MADVYLGQPIESMDRWVAIKVLLPELSQSQKFVAMFQSEGELGQMFKHPNIVRTWDVGKVTLDSGTLHLLTMDYVHGRDLGAVARHFRGERSPMPVNQALYIASEVLKGLAYAHELEDEAGMPLHLVNRDVSPANVMISFDGRVRLIDFGIAQATLDFRSQIGAIRGKLSYMSPEQVRGLPVDSRSDLFSLSVVLYQLLTGTEPFPGESEFEQMEKIRAVEPTAPSELNRRIPPGVEALLLKGLAKSPMARFHDALDMLEAVEAQRQALDLHYTPEALATFMQGAFQDDMELLHARVRKARQLLKDIKGPWTDTIEAVVDAPITPHLFNTRVGDSRPAPQQDNDADVDRADHLKDSPSASGDDDAVTSRAQPAERPQESPTPDSEHAPSASDTPQESPEALPHAHEEALPSAQKSHDLERNVASVITDLPATVALAEDPFERGEVTPTTDKEGNHSRYLWTLLMCGFGLLLLIAVIVATAFFMWKP